MSANGDHEEDPPVEVGGAESDSDIEQMDNVKLDKAPKKSSLKYDLLIPPLRYSQQLTGRAPGKPPQTSTTAKQSRFPRSPTPAK